MEKNGSSRCSRFAEILCQQQKVSELHVSTSVKITFRPSTLHIEAPRQRQKVIERDRPVEIGVAWEVGHREAVRRRRLCEPEIEVGRVDDAVQIQVVAHGARLEGHPGRHGAQVEKRLQKEIKSGKITVRMNGTEQTVPLVKALRGRNRAFTNQEDA